MSIGFLDENQNRSYPFVPQVLPELRQLVVDLSAFFGPDQLFNLTASRLVLWEIRQDGTDWIFDFRIDGDPGPFEIRVDQSAEVFSTHHVASPSGWSYIYLTIGDISQIQAYVAPNLIEAPTVEDRCVVAPSYTAVETLELLNGPVNRSARDTWSYVSAVNPALNLQASLGAYVYDPDAYEASAGQVVATDIRFVDGRNTRVRLVDQQIQIQLVPGGGEGLDCCFVLPTDQSVRGTYRSISGLLPGTAGDIELLVRQGFTLTAVPLDNKLVLSYELPTPILGCRPPPPPPPPPPLPEPE